MVEIEEILEKLETIDDISYRKMFGGYGIYQDRIMFAMIDKEGIFRVKCDDNLKDELENIGGKKHFKMPYYSIPDSFFNDDKKFLKIVKKAITVSKQ